MFAHTGQYIYTVSNHTGARGRLCCPFEPHGSGGGAWGGGALWFPWVWGMRSLMCPVDDSHSLKMCLLCASPHRRHLGFNPLQVWEVLMWRTLVLSALVVCIFGRISLEPTAVFNSYTHILCFSPPSSSYHTVLFWFEPWRCPGTHGDPLPLPFHAGIKESHHQPASLALSFLNSKK